MVVSDRSNFGPIPPAPCPEKAGRGSKSIINYRLLLPSTSRENGKGEKNRYKLWVFTTIHFARKREGGEKQVYCFHPLREKAGRGSKSVINYRLLLPSTSRENGKGEQISYKLWVFASIHFAKKREGGANQL